MNKNDESAFKTAILGALIPHNGDMPVWKLVNDAWKNVKLDPEPTSWVTMGSYTIPLTVQPKPLIPKKLRASTQLLRGTAGLMFDIAVARGAKFSAIDAGGARWYYVKKPAPGLVLTGEWDCSGVAFDAEHCDLGKFDWKDTLEEIG